VIVLIVPELRARAASALGEALRVAVSGLAIRNAESVVADHVTASVAVVTGRVDGWIDRAHLLTRAVLAVPGVSAAGGNRVVAVSA
jgi:PleD family two-component response regulator